MNIGWTGAAVAADYTVAVSGGTLSADRTTLTIAAGAATATLTVTPVNDTALESTEAVTVTVLAGPGYAPGATASATGTVADNDVALSVAATDATGAEQAANAIVFTVTRTGYLAWLDGREPRLERREPASAPTTPSPRTARRSRPTGSRSRSRPVRLPRRSP